MKRVYTAAHLPDAQLLVDKLVSHGIDARVVHGNLQGGVGDLPHIYPEVWIDEARDWDAARSLARKFDQGVTPTQGVVRCPECNEENPATFEICWQCGTVIPPSTEPHGREEEEKESD